MTSFQLKYFREVLGIQNLIFANSESSQGSKDFLKNGKNPSQTNLIKTDTGFHKDFCKEEETFYARIFKRGSLNSKWLFMTSEPLSPHMLEGLDKICVALYAQKDFLHLSFDPSVLFSNQSLKTFPEGKEQKIKAQTLKISSLKENFFFHLRKWLSFSSFELGMIFGASIFDALFENGIVSKNQVENKRKSKKVDKIKLKERKKMKSITRRYELKEMNSKSLLFTETLSQIFYCDARPCTVTYGLEELFPPSAPITKNQPQPSSKKEEEEKVQLKKRQTWKQIQELLKH